MKYREYRRSIVLMIGVLLLCTVDVYGQTNLTGSLQAPSPQIVGKAKEWFSRFQTGRIDRSQLDATVNRELTAKMIASESASLMPFGHPTAFVYAGSERVGGARGYDFGLLFNGPKRIIEAIAFDADGKIAGIDFQILLPNGQR